MLNAQADSLDGPTHMTTSGSCGPSTDVNVYDGVYGDGWYGLYSCKELNEAGECETSDVKLDTDEVGTEQRRRRKTYCHEFGHSVGLRHYGSGGDGHVGCMVSGFSYSIRYNDHEIADHINMRY